MYEQIASNKRRSALLIIGFGLLVGLVVFAINYLIGGGLIGFAIAAIIAIALSWISYFNSDKVALAMSHAKPADELTYARYHNLVEGLCIASGLPKPRLYIIDDPAPNAFATGRNPQHAAIAVTTGLLEKMNRVELEGVLAHELSHVKNYDVLIMTLAVTMVGIIALLSDFFLRFMFWGGGRRGNDDRNNPLGAIIALFGIVLLIFSPITRYPPGLISALKKLKDDTTVIHTASKATAHLWIEEPLDTESKRPGVKMNKLFATHPPLDDRIAALEAM